MPRATPLRHDREKLAEAIFTEIVVWHVSVPVRGSRHNYKYRLALVVDGVCVLRYDNEAGKGDHMHVGEREAPYAFRDLMTLYADFEVEVSRWLDRNQHS